MLRDLYLPRAIREDRVARPILFQIKVLDHVVLPHNGLGKGTL